MTSIKNNQTQQETTLQQHNRGEREETEQKQPHTHTHAEEPMGQMESSQMTDLSSNI